MTTVSRALGGYTDVAAATRARVSAEATRIDYRPNQLARRLRGGRTGAIGLVLPSAPGQFDDPFFLRMLAAVGPRLADAGLDLLVTAARPGTDELRTYRQLVEGKRVDGFLVARTRRHDDRIAYLLDNGVAFVAHGRTKSRRPYAHVDIDGEMACRIATERLIGFGHRSIALINASDTYMFAFYRQRGWFAALRAAALPAWHLVSAEPTEENGFRLANELLGAAEPPTAMLCATDRIAVGALHAIKNAGLRAGRDVSVIGYDDLPLATYTDPPLTTIAQPIERAVARMVEMLLALLAGADPAAFAELLPASLVARSSDGPVRTNTAETRGPPTSLPGGTHDQNRLPGP